MTALEIIGGLMTFGLFAVIWYTVWTVAFKVGHLLTPWLRKIDRNISARNPKE